jgi:hypothetical protein
LSIEGLVQHHALQILEDRAIMLRRVNRATKAALEENKDLVVNIYLSATAAEELIADFLRCWKGIVIFFCSKMWSPNCCWFQSFTEALTAGGEIKFGMVDLMVKVQYFSQLILRLSDLLASNSIYGPLSIHFDGATSSRCKCTSGHCDRLCWAVSIFPLQQGMQGGSTSEISFFTATNLISI